jgi:hypothetical protein
LVLIVIKSTAASGKVVMAAKLLILCFLLQTSIVLTQKTAPTKPAMEVHGVVPDVIDVAPTAKIQVN